jgi:hypothetical protein
MDDVAVESSPMREATFTLVQVALDSHGPWRHWKCETTHMVMVSAALVVQCQVALGMTQAELGELVGRDRRTIQRWQDRGCTLLPQDAQVLADALRPVRPDLAEELLVLAAPAGAAQSPIPATPEVVDAILRAATDAAKGTPPGAIRAAVAAAFAEAKGPRGRSARGRRSAGRRQVGGRLARVELAATRAPRPAPRRR